MGNKAILMSIQPRWVAKILNGEKTIEVRKKFHKDYVGWVYIYCTKDIGKHGENQLLNFFKGNEYFIGKDIDKYNPNDICYLGQNGKVVARFWCDKVEHFEFETISRDIDGYWWDNGKAVEHSFITKQCCLTTDEFRKYIEYGGGYAIHISKLKIFDKPREINEFYTKNLYKDINKMFTDEKPLDDGTWVRPIKKAPQSWCYVEGK